MALNTSNPELHATWKELTEGKTGTNWILWAVGDDGKSLAVVGKGTGGLSELLQQLSDDTKVYFGAFLVTGVDVRENVTSRRPKFVVFNYIGSKVSALKKAKVSVQKQDVQKFWQGIAASLDVFDPAHDLAQAEVAKKLLAAGGAHKPTQYEFGPDQVYHL